jgi:hypothetical protein
MDAVSENGFCARLGFVEPLDPDAPFTSVVPHGHPILLEIVSSDDESDGPDPEIEMMPSRSLPEIPTFTPADMAERIDTLAEIGGGRFTREECEMALRLAFFNTERAVGFLVEGMPRKAKGFITESDEPMTLNDGLEMRDKEALERLFNATRIDFPMLIQYYLACDRNEQMTLELLRDP